MSPGRRKKPVEYFDCPHCGAPVKSTARACRECGSDLKTGWQSEDEIDYQSIELPDALGDELDEARGPGATRGDRPKVWMVVVTIVLVVAMAYWAMFL